jgi:hypothetical protein
MKELTAGMIRDAVAETKNKEAWKGEFIGWFIDIAGQVFGVHRRNGTYYYTFLDEQEAQGEKGERI